MSKYIVDDQWLHTDKYLVNTISSRFLALQVVWSQNFIIVQSYAHVVMLEKPIMVNCKVAVEMLPPSLQNPNCCFSKLFGYYSCI